MHRGPGLFMKWWEMQGYVWLTVISWMTRYDSWWQLMTFVCEDNDENAVVTHVYPVEKGVSPIATLSCWSLMFLTSTILISMSWKVSFWGRKSHFKFSQKKMDDFEVVSPYPVECGTWVCQGRWESALKNHIVSFHHVLHWVGGPTGKACKMRVRTGI